MLSLEWSLQEIFIAAAVLALIVGSKFRGAE